ncbi:hypothetical protein BGX23_002414 [Mortierella sp. AD031]|nr:hypothetical protein BGX23_002414 [Mortierella sp. AD031]
MVTSLRDILIASPGLDRITIDHWEDTASHRAHYRGSMGYRVFNEVVVHSNLEHITTTLEFRWFQFNIRTPNLRTIGPGVIFRNVQDLMQTLRLCPKLEDVDAAELRGMDDDLSISYCAQQDKQDFEASGGDREAMEWSIQKLMIRSSQHRSYTIPRLLRRIPNLVRLEVGSIPPQAVEIIGKTCGDCLEDVRFYLRDPCYGEMNWFLERCSLLKTVRGLGLAVKAKDLMKDAKDEGMTSSGSGGGWTCLGLTELQIKIHGVPRLNARQDAVLQRQQQRHNDNNPRDDQDDGTEEEEYAEALRQQRRCESVQHRVFQQLAQLHNLRHLDLGFQPLAYKPHQTRRYCYGSSQSRKDRILLCDSPIPDSLSLSLSTSEPSDGSQVGTSGLEQLETLRWLETFGFKGVNHRIGEAETRWMGERWPRLTRVLGRRGVVATMMMYCQLH